jgi:hypothetical protein
VIWAVTFVIGAIIGLVVGRWWALLAALAVFVWIYTETGVDEVPHWALALMYAGVIAVGIAAGVACRAALRRSGPRGTNG